MILSNCWQIKAGNMWAIQSKRILICAVRFFKLVLDLAVAGLVQISLWKVCASSVFLHVVISYAEGRTIGYGDDGRKPGSHASKRAFWPYH